jgi:hypothetical protein
VAIGWAELLDEMLRTPAGSESAWTELRELAAHSPRSAVLEPALRLAERLPAADRHLLALALATCSAPLEWPLQGEALRPLLTAALGDLLRQMDPAQPGSLARNLDLSLEAEVHAAGLVALQGAHQMLRLPCRRDEIRIVAHLCNRGRAACHAGYHRALSRDAGDSVTAAVIRYEFARGRFVAEARAFNQVYGNVLFETGEAPLQQGA